MDYEKEINLLKERNKIVENNKAWEISLFRKITILIITYVIAAWWMYTINVSNFWLNALIPTGGYFLSTLTIPFIKKWWINKN